ncbi:MAG: HIT domain-containing protein [Candidatus Babeliaceae bacterium]|nr:HIT domain-containing protein [Candidatus Babeliaceae bacterium]
MECVFCKIIRGEMASKKIAENDTLIVIQDIFPKAPVHYLIIPKKHTQDIQSLPLENLNIATDIFAIAQHLSEKIEGARDFKLHVNSGKNAGQIVMHLHVHFIAGNLTGAL